MSYSVPRLVRDQENKFSIVFYVDGKRYRISNGKKFGVALNPNKEPLSNRERFAEELRLHVSRSLKGGWGQSLKPTSTLMASIEGGKSMPEAKETYRKSFLSTMLRLEAFLKQTKRSNRGICGI